MAVAQTYTNNARLTIQSCKMVAHVCLCNGSPEQASLNSQARHGDVSRSDSFHMVFCCQKLLNIFTETVKNSLSYQNRPFYAEQCFGIGTASVYQMRDSLSCGHPVHVAWC